MGTCFSKSKTPKKAKCTSSTTESEAASASHQEEEKVKEVLSETPRPSLRARSLEKESPRKPDPVSPEKRREAEKERVDVSDTVSGSESASVALTEEGNAWEVQQPIRSKSFPGKREWVREEFSGRKSPSPARRREVSPERKAEGLSARAAGRSLYGGSSAGEWRSGPRRAGEEMGMRGSGRRSRSPAAPVDSGCRAAVNRSGSRRTPQSPGRCPVASRDRTGRIEDGNNDVCSGGGGGEKGEERQLKLRHEFDSAAGESLENPLVSLECFIFL